MIEKLKKFGKEEIIAGSLTLFIMINIYNFLNYVSHFFMARLLGPSDYGIFAVLMSLVYIFTIPAEGIQTVISRYTTRFNIKKEYGKMKYLLAKGIKKVFILETILFLIYLPLSLILSYFLKIKADLIIFTGVLLFGILLLPILRGILQGRKKFKSLGINMILESFLKILLSVIFVLSGFRVYGAIGGVILAILAVLVLSFSFIKKILKSRLKKSQIKGIYSYSFPVMVVMLSVVLMASMDIIFAKIYFPEDLAGKYAVASMMGKIIFFGTLAISKAMFPITSESFDRGEKKEKTKFLFTKAFFLVAGICLSAVLIYWIFPELIISVLFGRGYAEVSNILVFIGISFSFISLSNLSLMYALSVQKEKIWRFFVFILFQILVFSLFHENLMQFVIGFMVTNIIMFAASFIFVNRGKSDKDRQRC